MNSPISKTDKPLAAQFVFTRAAVSMAMLWLSFPPVGLAGLAWLSLVPLLHIAACEPRLKRGNYYQIYTAGLFYWLATFYFIPIPHPALWIGWLVISAYLANYLPVFVAASRGLHLNFHIPFAFAAAISWTGLELIRNHLFTGMGLVSLAHTQFRHPILLQICDLSGGYTLTFTMVLVAASFLIAGYRFFRKRAFNAIGNVILGVTVIALVLWYGNHQLQQPSTAEETLLVGLIQGSMDTDLLSSPEAFQEFQINKTRQYQRLTTSALESWPEVDLVVWPENGWPYPDLHPDTDKAALDREAIAQYEYAHFDAFAKLFVPTRKTPNFLVGALTYDPVKQDSFGSALFIDDQGIVQNRYYKNHLVMFGEFVPLADWFPLFRKIPAIGKGLVAGDSSITIDVGNFKVTPSICFESTVPHYIRSQVQQLARQNSEPDILVNLTNDGWFYGTSCLDFHLACNVFRAVEMRKPHLVCANTGLSAYIDADGKIIEQGPRRATQTILATVEKTSKTSFYRDIGDLIPIVFACLAVLGCLAGFATGSSSDQERLDDPAGEIPQHKNSSGNQHAAK